ncbi:MAG: SDR family oxidoreductase [Salinibacterium sp.]|nr:SDR family oxidoreductase [Salinibacterium sp.]MBF0672496.1 SDR family oxidoreductase [Salinibacterium sp.]
MRIDFTGKIVVVTGGAGGFGSATARTFAGAGARVVVSDINLEKAQAVASELEGAIAVRTDVTSPESITELFETVRTEFGGLDILVNNAGAPTPKRDLVDTSLDDINWLININYRSTVLASQAALPLMKGREGANIVNVASISARRPRPGGTVYNSTKAGVESFTLALAAEVAPEVRVNSVSPVISETGFLTSIYGHNELSDADRQRLVTGIPLGRTADTQDVANTIAFLASDLASFHTGVNLQVDGGRSIN